MVESRQTFLMRKPWARRYLTCSAVLLVGVALAYGIDPAALLPAVLGFRVESVGLVHVFRALMGLYLAMGCFWFVGAIRPSVARPAVLSEIVFMGGLGLGRLLSLLLDGWPGPILFAGLVAEIIFAGLGVFVLKDLPREPG